MYRNVSLNQVCRNPCQGFKCAEEFMPASFLAQSHSSQAKFSFYMRVVCKRNLDNEWIWGKSRSVLPSINVRFVIARTPQAILSLLIPSPLLVTGETKCIPSNYTCIFTRICEMCWTLVSVLFCLHLRYYRKSPYTLHNSCLLHEYCIAYVI